MTIAQALLKTWKNEKAHDPCTAPLMYYLTYNYNERYVKLCYRVEIEPVKFSHWLRRKIDTI